MKTLVFLVFAILTATASAQAPAKDEEAGLKIIRISLQRTAVKGPSTRAVAPTDPAFQKDSKKDRAADSDTDSAPALHRLSKDAELATKNTQIDDKGNPRASRSDVVSSGSTNAAIVYFASVVVKNTGTKTVTAVNWEYLLFEDKGSEPVKRYQVRNKKVIAPGE